MTLAVFQKQNLHQLKYKYQDGLGYHQSTKDASTNFFFDVLPKGIYVFEYDLRVNNAGEMSNWIQLYKVCINQNLVVILKVTE